MSDFFASVWDWFKNVFGDVLQWLFGWLQPLVAPIKALVKALVAISLFVWGLFMTVLDLVDVSSGLTSIAETFDAMTNVVRSMPVAPIMGQLNRVFPLNEALIMAGLLVALYLLILGLRFVAWLIRVIYYIIEIIVKLIKRG